MLFHKFGSETGFQSDLVNQLLVIEGNTQFFRNHPSDGASAAAEFTADGNDFLFHGLTS